MFNQQFLRDFYNGNYCPSDKVSSNSDKLRCLSAKMENIENQLFKNLDKKSRRLLSKLIEYHSEELNEFAFRAYFDGITFATTILTNSANSED